MASLSGIASGVGTNTIVDQLMALERRPLVVKEQQQLAQARQTTLRDVATRLRDLSSASADLRSMTLWAPKQGVEPSDPSKCGEAPSAPARVVVSESPGEVARAVRAWRSGILADALAVSPEPLPA